MSIEEALGIDIEPTPPTPQPSIDIGGYKREIEIACILYKHCFPVQSVTRRSGLPLDVVMALIEANGWERMKPDPNARAKREEKAKRQSTHLARVTKKRVEPA